MSVGNAAVRGMVMSDVSDAFLIYRNPDSDPLMLPRFEPPRPKPMTGLEFAMLSTFGGVMHREPRAMVIVCEPVCAMTEREQRGHGRLLAAGWYTTAWTYSRGPDHATISASRLTRYADRAPTNRRSARARRKAARRSRLAGGN